MESFVKRLAVVSQAQVSSEVYTRQLSDYMGDLLYIKGYSFAKGFNTSALNSYDLIITSCESVRKKIVLQNGIDTIRTPIMVAQRVLDVNDLGELFHLPPKSQVLVVTSFEETAHEIASVLRSYGFDDLDLIPYYPGVKSVPADVGIAITNSALDLIPSNVSKIITVGVHRIDISTVVQILLAMELPLERINAISRSYIREMIELSLRRLKALEETRKVNAKLNAILDVTHDGIIAVNDQGEISVFNASAELFLSLASSVVMGKKLHTILPELNLDEVLQHNETDSNVLGAMRGKSYLINKVPVKLSGATKGAVATFRSVTDVQIQEREVRRQSYNSGHTAWYKFDDIVGNSPILHQTIEKAKKLVNSELTILIVGETGTGKELFAQSIHNKSNRGRGPFVAVNFAALPENLIESELFGYEEGAFTGARKGGMPGLFEQAHEGTIFLDEIGDASLGVQTRLLRILDEKKVRRLGSKKVLPIDIRVLAATNQNLEQLMDEGKFRHDLYYRLNVLPLYLPPLRERREDIVPLIDHFISLYHGAKLKLPGEIIAYLSSLPWPGNIRQLESVVQYICTLIQNGVKIKLKEVGAIFEPSFSQGKGYVGERVKELDLNRNPDQNGNVYELDNPEQVNLVLKTIFGFQKAGISASRRRLASSLGRYNLTEAKIRRILDVLLARGLIEAGTTRQGTWLTTEGQETCKKMERSSRK